MPRLEGGQCHLETYSSLLCFVWVPVHILQIKSLHVDSKKKFEINKEINKSTYS